MNILVDWLTVSIRNMSLEKLLEILKLSDQKMEHKYSRWLGDLLYLGGISVHYGEYLILDMCGSGCRFLESLYDNQINWIDFIEQFLCLEGSHLARLDIACDDKPEDGEKGILSFKTMARHCEQRRYICRSTKLPRLIKLGEESVIFGAPQSDRRLRIYNKALERGVEGHWIRAEFQLRNEAALSFYMRALERADIGQAYQGMLFDYLRFTKEKNNCEHTERLTPTRWWRTFCADAKKIKGFYVGGLEYNLESLERYLGNQTSSSMKTYLAAHGGDVSGLLEMADTAKYNKKQEFLVKAQSMVDKMNADYGITQEERDRLFEKAIADNPLNRSERVVLNHADLEQRRFVQLVDNWHWSPENEAYKERLKLCDEDLSFD